MIFRKAEAGEQDGILALYRAVSASPFSTWNDGYPGGVEIENDLAAGTLYVLADRETLIGCISIVPENELDGLTLWTDTQRAGEIARVAVAAGYQGRRLGRHQTSVTAGTVMNRTRLPPYDWQSDFPALNQSGSYILWCAELSR